MVELFVRLSICIGFLGLGASGLAPLELMWKLATLGAALSTFGWRMEAKGLKNPGIAGFFAIGEALLLAFAFTSSADLRPLTFLVLLPCAYAAIRFRAPMMSMAPLAASAVVGADLAFSQSATPTPQSLIQAAGVLAMCLLLAERKPMRAPDSTSVNREVVQVLVPAPAEDGLLQLRETYRKLRDAYADLERKSRKDKIAARLARVQTAQGERFFTELTRAIRDLTGASELAVYTLAQYDRALVVRSVTDQFPRELKTATLNVDVTQAQILVREQAEQALAAMAIGSAPCSVPLVDKGRVVGMVCALDADESSREAITEIAPEVAQAVTAESKRESESRRLHELELLYELSSVASGAAKEPDLAARLTHELSQTLRLDGASIISVKGGRERTLAHDGTKAQLLDAMSFAEGPGLKGWIATGSPELVLFDARQDPRCDPEQSLRRRIGSFYLAPIWRGTELYGFLSAITHVVGAIDTDQIATLRLAAAEFSRALERLQGERYGGLMTPKEFSAATRGREGTLVYLEPLRREQILAAHGLSAFEQAIRKLAHQIRAKLPVGSMLCRRRRGDFVAFLATNEDFARNWANDVAASALLIGFTGTDKPSVALALRAKVAAIGTQLDGVLEEVAA